MTDEQHRLYAFASYMRHIEPQYYDQTRDVHADGSPSCLLAHAMRFFRPDLWRGTEHPRHPRLMKETAAELFDLEYCQTAFLYHAFPFGRGEPTPTTGEAADHLIRLAEGSGAAWRRD